MEVFFFFFFTILFSSIFIDTEANCPAVKCSHDGPEILFPFSVQGLQPLDCSYPGFELICRENTTTIHFPSYGDLVVKSISYDNKKLSLLDPKNCVHEVFLNLNLSLTPFQYYYVVKNYTYLNCSSLLSPSFVQVPCLSGPRHHVYVVESFETVPVSCKPVRTISIPFSYSPYLSDNSFGLGFTWDLPGMGGGCRESWVVRCFNLARGKVSSILIFIFMVATLIGVKIYCSKNAWVEKLFMHYEILKKAKHSGANVKEVSNRIKTTSGYGNCGSDFKGMLPNEDCVCILETTGIDGKVSMK
ncbi:hypothetical protein ACSBR2_037772 [Camellia fascicularis]